MNCKCGATAVIVHNNKALCGPCGIEALDAAGMYHTKRERPRLALPVGASG